MKLKIAAQIDKNINFSTDSTIYLLQEAQRRGYTIFCYNTEDLYSRNGVAYANATEIEIKDRAMIQKGVSYLPLKDVDLILMRQDPPVNMRYMTTTYLLENCGSLVINNPKSVRNWPEKITKYKDFTLPTLISENYDIIKEFFVEYKDVVLKPLYSFGGRDIIRVNEFNCNLLSTHVEMLKTIYQSPIVIQQFYNDITIHGDKRIIILDGNILGGFKRFNKKDFRTNSCLGGDVIKCKITNLEMSICEKLGKDLSADGILFAGVDIIGEKYLSEINVTSPTGLVFLDRLYNKDYSIDFLDLFESKLLN